jgi:phage baseplate assembly protein gpV
MKFSRSSLLLLLIWVEVASAASFLVKDVTITLKNEVYRLNTQIEYRLTEEAQEALSNGVPLTLRVELGW